MWLQLYKFIQICKIVTNSDCVVFASYGIVQLFCRVQWWAVYLFIGSVSHLQSCFNLTQLRRQHSEIPRALYYSAGNVNIPEVLCQCADAMVKDILFVRRWQYQWAHIMFAYLSLFDRAHKRQGPGVQSWCIEPPRQEECGVTWFRPPYITLFLSHIMSSPSLPRALSVIFFISWCLSISPFISVYKFLFLLVVFYF